MTDIDLVELAARLDEEGLVVIDVRTEGEYAGLRGYPCDPRQGHIPGAVHLDLQELTMLSPAAIRERVGVAADSEVIVYCHSGQRSAIASHALEAAGYRPRNFVGSWHAWSNDPSLPVATGG
jgi:thiosulfate/3-mercaptopyruvate sulfurtransferase